MYGYIWLQFAAALIKILCMEKKFTRDDPFFSIIELRVAEDEYAILQKALRVFLSHQRISRDTDPSLSPGKTGRGFVDYDIRATETLVRQMEAPVSHNKPNIETPEYT